MNIKSFLMVLASGAILVLTACDGTDTGGSGGSSGEGGKAGTGGAGGTAGTGGMTGTGGAGGAPACDPPINQQTMEYTCAEWTTFTPCPGGKLSAAGQTALDAYMACICDMAKGNCAADCDGKCANPPGPDKDAAKCMACVMAASTGTGMCVNEAGMCANN